MKTNSYVTREKAIAAADSGSIRQRWEYGRADQGRARGRGMSAPDLSAGIEELSGLINFRVGAWHDFGYETPPTQDCKPIPPLGQRSAEAIKSAHGAVDAIDELLVQLHALRAQLLAELRADEDAGASRVDAMLAEARAARCAAARLLRADLDAFLAAPDE